MRASCHSRSRQFESGIREGVGGCTRRVHPPATTAQSSAATHRSPPRVRSAPRRNYTVIPYAWPAAGCVRPRGLVQILIRTFNPPFTVVRGTLGVGVPVRPPSASPVASPGLTRNGRCAGANSEHAQSGYDQPGAITESTIRVGARSAPMRRVRSYAGDARPHLSRRWGDRLTRGAARET
jgi:hypothetical protein